MKRRTSRRRMFWAFPDHIREGLMLYLDSKKLPGMVRVRVTLAPKKPRKQLKALP